MTNHTANTEHLDRVRMIASDALGIETFALTGKLSIDFRVFSVEDINRALETAYDAGLVAGFHLRGAS